MTPERFKQIRKELGLSQRKLSDVTGLSNSSIVKYEAGTQEIPLIVSLGLIALKHGLKAE